MQKKNSLGKFFSCSHIAENGVRSRAQPIIQMKGMFPSTLPSGGMVNIPLWLQLPDWSKATHFLREESKKKKKVSVFYS